MRRTILGLVIGAAACGSDSNGPAAGYECLGAPLPTTAPATVTVAGQIRSNALAPSALSGAIVTAFRTGDTTTLAADTSDTPGLYSLTISTGGTPVDGYLRVTHSGQVDTYAYPSRPLFMDLATNVLMPTSGELDFLAAAVGVTQADGNGFIGVIVKDCSGVPISGATVSTTPAAGAVKYNSGSTPSGSATSTSSDGVAYVFNVTAGNVTVRANGGGNTLRAHVVNARADVVTLTEIQP